jgi:hypothetical protein
MDTFMEELNGSTECTNWDAHLTLKMDAVNKCLAAMRVLARKDLQARGGCALTLPVAAHVKR